ncbi:MAG: ergothioneine biosynthesis protein EgtB [Alphaproteobacteria bacterium]|nr:ergothioneine biosynthesis protein EgtB [Alphaproteobacteria bacterium]
MSSAVPSAAPEKRAGRDAWRERYGRIRARTPELAVPLSAEDQTIQSMPDASPTKWHLAHTSWFFETFLLKPYARGYAVFDDAFAYLFNSYYEAAGPRHPRPLRGMLSRPSLETVAAYRAHVDQAMLALIDGADDALRATIAPLVELGLHHEQQHQELLLMDVKHLFSLNPLQPSYGAFPPALVRRAPPLEWIEFDGGLFDVGHDGAGFAFDNESPRHRVWLEPFRLASRLTTNAEYCAFIEDGGYARPELWLSDGWAAARDEGWTAPLYWTRETEEWRIFTLAGPQPVNPAAPVCHVSYYEADAFARWSGKRLAREAEWEVAARSAASPGDFAESGYLHPRPARAQGLAQMFGDVWEWTQSPYTPYPGFRPAAGAVGEYNGKFMANQFVLRGGSAVTPADHIRATYRNFYPPAARWAFAGIRLADDR